MTAAGRNWSRTLSPVRPRAQRPEGGHSSTLVGRHPTPPPAPNRRLYSSVRIKIISPISAKRMKRSEEHTSELQSLMRISYAVFCLKKKIHKYTKFIHLIYTSTLT